MLLAALVFGAAAAWAGLYYYQRSRAVPEAAEQNKPAAESRALGAKNSGTSKMEPDAGKGGTAPADKEKYKKEIQALLDRQCAALSSKNVGLLADTLDRSDEKLFQKYEKSVGALLDMADSVVKCEYKVKNVELGESRGKLTAETTEKGSLAIKLIDGSTKIFDTPDKPIAGNYVREKGEWKQVIKIGD